MNTGAYSTLLGQAQGQRHAQEQEQEIKEPPAKQETNEDGSGSEEGEGSDNASRWPLNSSQIALLLQRVERQKGHHRRQRRLSVDDRGANEDNEKDDIVQKERLESAPDYTPSEGALMSFPWPSLPLPSPASVCES